MSRNKQMTNSLKHKIFIATDCLSEQMMFDYIDHKLNARESHSVEKHLLQCELCSDALEGLELTKNRLRITSINQKISERIAATGKEAKIVGFNYKLIISLAASILLLVGGIFFFNQLRKNDTIAEFKAEPAKSLPPPPAISTSPSDEIISDSENIDAPATTNQKVNLETETEFSENEKMKNNQETAVAEEQRAEPFTKPVTESGAGATGSVISTNKDVVQTDANIKASAVHDAPAYDAAPQKRTDQRAKNDIIDQLKEKAEPEAEDISGNESSQLNEATITRSSSATVSSDKKNQEVAISRHSKKAERKNNASFSKSAVEEEPKQNKELDDEDIIAYAPKSVAARDEASEISLISAISEQVPEFPGGQDSLLHFIRKNFSLPPGGDNKQSEIGTIFIQITVDEKGNVKNPFIVKGINPEANKEALRVINSMPKWKPGTINGKPVSQQVNIPVKPEYSN